jgi:hypothetical protein
VLQNLTYACRLLACGAIPQSPRLIAAWNPGRATDLQTALSFANLVFFCKSFSRLAHAIVQTVYGRQMILTFLAGRESTRWRVAQSKIVLVLNTASLESGVALKPHAHLSSPFAVGGLQAGSAESDC